jgi:stage III sporulation protein AH
MNKIGKNRIVVVVLVLMILSAGYLNYRDSLDSVSGTSAETEESEVQSVYENSETYDLSEGVLTPDDEAGATEVVDGTDSDAEPVGGSIGEAIFVESTAVIPEYFAEAKVERENARAKSQSILYDLMANADTPEEEKSQAAQQILELQKRVENEAAAEAMIKAKGFDETYVRIYDDCVDVIVDRSEITQQEAAQIQDIITRITSLEAKDIRISLLKVNT